MAFGNIVHGVKIDQEFNYAGGVLDLLNPYALLGGLVTLALFTFHGTVFVGLKTVGEIRERARNWRCASVRRPPCWPSPSCCGRSPTGATGRRSSR
ncbi:hypothetical protein SVIOM74S_02759 [Streptomyces violarus]